MKQSSVNVGGRRVTLLCVNTIVVGTGAAGFNAADRLYDYGQTDVAMVTEGLNMGTSRNTGSDKQTYYKLSLSGADGDSVVKMAQTLFEGGAMDGDIALCEAALSAQSFFKLAEVGVPFPQNEVGEYVGYQTDNDPLKRGTSAGPLTSKFMTQRLQARVEKKQIPILDGYRVIQILKADGVCRGVLCLNLNALGHPDHRFLIINAVNTIYATGAPAGMYLQSVFPQSQTGASGIAFEAGVKGKNLTEWQYGIASLDFRWNLSGTYQQVLPRYLSAGTDGTEEREFLQDYFPDDTSLLRAVFLKGYQWPFDAKRLDGYGSSCIDMAVYHEMVHKNRVVYLDYTKNPAALKDDFSNLDSEAYAYLHSSDALLDSPVKRLKKMNPEAYELFQSHGIDFERDYVKVAVCAQHNNGGLCGDVHWESNLPHFFPVGEVNGTHGITRPGGSALNSGQVGGARAAQYIAGWKRGEPDEFEEEVLKNVLQTVERLEGISVTPGKSTVRQQRAEISGRMSEHAAVLRNACQLEQILVQVKQELTEYWSRTVIDSVWEFAEVYLNYDLLVCQYVYLSAFVDYIEQGGGSRGAYLICSKLGTLPCGFRDERFRSIPDDGRFNGKIQETEWAEGQVRCTWRDVRPIPEPGRWFEQVWRDYGKEGEA